MSRQLRDFQGYSLDAIINSLNYDLDTIKDLLGLIVSRLDSLSSVASSIPSSNDKARLDQIIANSRRTALTLGAGRLVLQNQLTIATAQAQLLFQNTYQVEVLVEIINADLISSNTVYYAINSNNPTPSTGVPIGASDEDKVILGDGEFIWAIASPTAVDVRLIVSKL